MHTLSRCYTYEMKSAKKKRMERKSRENLFSIISTARVMPEASDSKYSVFNDAENSFMQRFYQNQNQLDLFSCFSNHVKVSLLLFRSFKSRLLQLHFNGTGMYFEIG